MHLESLKIQHKSVDTVNIVSMHYAKFVKSVAHKPKGKKGIYFTDKNHILNQYFIMDPEW